MRSWVGRSAISRFVAVVLLCSLAACASPRTSAPSYIAPVSGPAIVVTPDHGASALPGGWLPCGFPTQNEGGDLASTTGAHYANCSVALNSTTGGGGGDLKSSAFHGLQPADIVRAYNFPASNAGMTVAIVDAFDDPRAEADMGVYRAKFGLRPCTTANGCFRKVNQEGKPGPYPHESRAWGHEIALDVEMVSAVCPNCHILLVEANSAAVDNLGAAVDEAVALGAHVVSNSYFAVEWRGETAEDVHYNHPGVAITVSSGDATVAYQGEGGGGDLVTRAASGYPYHVGPYYPASSPYVTSVGGTELEQIGNVWIQDAWKYDGRGCSRYEPRPTFQPSLCPTRASVDLAVVGDPRTGVAIYASQAGGWVVAAGTSVGAPVIAAAYALSGNPQGPGFSYSHLSSFTDIKPAGFDRATGLGSPYGVGGL